jgi:hypothetical protein
MTPANEMEVILAKISPVFVLLTLDIGLALLVARAAFDLPIRGSLTLLFAAGSMCVLSGIGLGTAMATLTKTQAQAQLLSFFINPPLALSLGRHDPRRGDTGVAAACRRAEPGLSLRSDLARGPAEGNRRVAALPEPHCPCDLRDRDRRRERLALPTADGVSVWRFRWQRA